MGTFQQDVLGLSEGIATPQEPAMRQMPSGWWVVPGVVLGLGLWALIGIGLHAALTGAGAEGPAAVTVTMAAPMDGVAIPVD